MDKDLIEKMEQKIAERNAALAQTETEVETIEATPEEEEALKKEGESVAEESTEQPNDNDAAPSEEVVVTPEDEDAQWQAHLESLTSPFKEPKEEVNDDGSEKPNYAKLSPEDEEKLRVFEQTVGDPIVQWAMQLKSEGKDVFEEIRKQMPLDVDSLSPKALFEMELGRLSIEGEEKEKELADFEELSKFAQNKAVEAFRDKLKSEQNAKKEFFRPDLEKLKSLEEAQRIQQQQADKILQDARDKANTLLGKIKGSSVYGLELTEARLKETEKYLNEEAPLRYNKDGSIDVESMLDDAIRTPHFKDIIQANVQVAKNLGKKQVLKEVTNPRGNETSRTLPPVAKTDKEALLEASKGKGPAPWKVGSSS